MSHDAARWAFELKLPAMQKLVILALAHRVNKFGVCWPRIDVIAGDCGCKRRTIERALSALEKAALIKVERHHNHSSLYSLRGGFTPEIDPSLSRADTSQSRTDTSQSRTDTSQSRILTRHKVAQNQSEESVMESVNQSAGITDGTISPLPVGSQANSILANWRPTPEHRRLATANGIDADAAEKTFRNRKAPIAGDVDAAFVAWMKGAQKRGFAKAAEKHKPTMASNPPRPGAITKEDAQRLGL